MRANKSPSFLRSLESHHYAPEDLESMRRAFQRACAENPLVAASEEQRQRLAKAILDIYQPYLTEVDLIAAATHWKKVM